MSVLVVLAVMAAIVLATALGVMALFARALTRAPLDTDLWPGGAGRRNPLRPSAPDKDSDSE